MDGTFSIRATVSGAMTVISVEGHAWQKSYNTLTEAAVEAAEIHIISDRTAQDIFRSKEGKNGSLSAIDLEELPKRDFQSVR